RRILVAILTAGQEERQANDTSVAERYIETGLRHFDTGGPRRGRAEYGELIAEDATSRHELWLSAIRKNAARRRGTASRSDCYAPRSILQVQRAWPFPSAPRFGTVFIVQGSLRGIF